MANYLIQIDGYLYESTEHGPRAAKPSGVNRYFTLPEALREVYGCGNAHILREEGGGFLVTVVAHAGRASSDLVHAPTGRTIRRGREARLPGLTRWSPGYGKAAAEALRPAGAL